MLATTAFSLVTLRVPQRIQSRLLSGCVGWGSVYLIGSDSSLLWFLSLSPSAFRGCATALRRCRFPPMAFGMSFLMLFCFVRSFRVVLISLCFAQLGPDQPLQLSSSFILCGSDCTLCSKSDAPIVYKNNDVSSNRIFTVAFVNVSHVGVPLQMKALQNFKRQ
jgi:hypothetical protein